MTASAHATIVVMRADSSPAEVDALQALTRAANLDTDVFAGRERTVVAVRAALAPELMAELAALPGVEAVMPRTEPPPVQTRDLRVASIRPLVPPAVLLEQVPLSEAGALGVHAARAEVQRILNGQDDRLIVVVGPCSIHDPEAALDYARRLQPLADELRSDLLVVMRVYFEKPRTTVGWKGFINDPRLDGSCAVNEGLTRARHLLVDIAAMGLPIGCEFLDPISPQFFADAVAWGAIGARTTESQIHRQVASGLSMAVGFKNGTSGNVQIAIDAIRAAASPHRFLGVTEEGLAAIVATRGNPDCHIVLRGGRSGPNYEAPAVAEALAALRAAGLPPRVMIDASHGNSDKDYRRQPVVAQAIGEQLAAGEHGIIGVMLESFLVAGRQELTDCDNLVYGQSVTDACLSWEMTAPVLRDLAAAVRARRAAAPTAGPATVGASAE